MESKMENHSLINLVLLMIMENFVKQHLKIIFRFI